MTVRSDQYNHHQICVWYFYSHVLHGNYQCILRRAVGALVDVICLSCYACDSQFSLNMGILFSFLLALGIVVDDAIVVIKIHRIFANGKKNIVEAAKLAAGGGFLPVFSGTLTTSLRSSPLLFWKIHWYSCFSFLLL